MFRGKIKQSDIKFLKKQNFLLSLERKIKKILKMTKINSILKFDSLKNLIKKYNQNNKK